MRLRNLSARLGRALAGLGVAWALLLSTGSAFAEEAAAPKAVQ